MPRSSSPDIVVPLLAQDGPRCFFTSLGMDRCRAAPQERARRAEQRRDVAVPATQPSPLSCRVQCARTTREVGTLWAQQLTELCIDDAPLRPTESEWLREPATLRAVVSYLPTGTLMRSMRRVCKVLREAVLPVLKERKARQVTLPREGRRIKFRDGYAVVRYVDGSLYEGRFTPDNGRHGRGVMWYHSDWHVDCGWGSSRVRWPGAAAYMEGEWSADGLLWGTVALANGDRCKVGVVRDNVAGTLQDVSVTYLIAASSSANPLPHRAGASSCKVEGIVRQRAARPKPRRDDAPPPSDAASSFDLCRWTRFSDSQPSECTLSVYIDGWAVPIGQVARVRSDLLLSELRSTMYNQGMLSLPSAWVFRIFDAQGRRRYREDVLQVWQALPGNRCAFLNQRLTRPWCNSVVGWAPGTRVHNSYVLCVVVVPCAEPKSALAPLLDAQDELLQAAADGLADAVTQCLRGSKRRQSQAVKEGALSAAQAAERTLKEEQADRDGDPLLHAARPPPSTARRGFAWRECMRAASGCGSVCVTASTVSPLGVTPLHVACDAGRREAVEALLMEGADVGAADWQGRLPLHYAAGRGSAPCVALVLEGDDGLNHIDVRSETGCTPLHEALYSGYLNTALWLVEQGARCDLADVHGMTPRRLAAAALPSIADYAASGDELRVVCLLQALRWGRDPWPAPPPSRRLPGPVQAAGSEPEPDADHVYCDWLRLRLTQGALVAELQNKVTTGRGGSRVLNVTGRTALHAAAAAGHAEVCERLAACPLVDVDAADASGCTALHAAAVAGHIRAVAALLRAKADTTARDSCGRTALHLAVRRYRYDTAELLARTMPQHAVAAVDAHGATAAHYCISQGAAPCRRLLRCLVVPLLCPPLRPWAPPLTELRRAALRRLELLPAESQHRARMSRGLRTTTVCSRPLLAAAVSVSASLRNRYGALLGGGSTLAAAPPEQPVSLAETAVRARNEVALQMLIDTSGLQVDFIASDGRSLLEIAHHRRSRGICHMLLQRGVALDTVSSQKVSVPEGAGEEQGQPTAAHTVSLGVGLYVALTTLDVDLSRTILRHPSFDLCTQATSADTGLPANPIEALVVMHRATWPQRWWGLVRRIAAEFKDEALRREDARRDDAEVQLQRRRSLSRRPSSPLSASSPKGWLTPTSPLSPGARYQAWSRGSRSPSPSGPASPVSPQQHQLQAKDGFEPETLRRPAFVFGGGFTAPKADVHRSPSRALLSGPSRVPRTRLPPDWPAVWSQWRQEAEQCFLSAAEMLCARAHHEQPGQLRVWGGSTLLSAAESRPLFSLVAACCQGEAAPVTAKRMLAAMPCDWTLTHPAAASAVAVASSSPARRRSQSQSFKGIASGMLHPLAVYLQYLEPQLLRLLELSQPRHVSELVHGLCSRRLFQLAVVAVESSGAARVQPHKEWERVDEDAGDSQDAELLRRQWLSALHLTALHGTAPGAVACAGVLCRGGGHPVSQESGEGLQALHYACISGGVQMVQLLLDMRADCDALATMYEDAQQSGTGAFSPTHLYDYPSTVCIASGTADRCVGAKGTTPLHLAAKRGHQAVVRILMLEGARVDRKDKADNTALMWAARYGHQKVCTALVEAGADCSRVNKYGDSALLLAARYGHAAAASALMRSPDCWRQTNPYTGHTVSHYASLRCTLPTLEQAALKQRTTDFRAPAAATPQAPAAAARIELTLPGAQAERPLHRTLGRREEETGPMPASESSPLNPAEPHVFTIASRSEHRPSLKEQQTALQDLAKAAQVAAVGSAGMFKMLRRLGGPFAAALPADDRKDAGGGGDGQDGGGDGQEGGADAKGAETKSAESGCGTELDVKGSEATARSSTCVAGLFGPAGTAVPSSSSGLKYFACALRRVAPRGCVARAERGPAKSSGEAVQGAAPGDHSAMQAMLAAARRRSEALGDDERYPALGRMARELAALCGGTEDVDTLKPFKPQVQHASGNPLVATAKPPLPPFQPVHYAVALGYNQAAQLLRPFGRPNDLLLFSRDGVPSGSEVERPSEAAIQAERVRAVNGLPHRSVSSLYTASFVASLPALTPGLQRIATSVVDAAAPPPPPQQEQVAKWHHRYAADVVDALTADSPFHRNPCDHTGADDGVVALTRWCDGVHGARCFYAVRRGFSNLLRGGVHLLSSADVLSDVRTTLLMTAAWYDQVQLIQDLIANGAVPGKAVKLYPHEASRGALTPVQLAVYRGSKQAAAALLDAGADPTTCDENGQTLCHHAVHRGAFETLKMLLHRDAPIDRENHISELPTHIATAKRQHRMVRLLDAWQSVLDVGRDGSRRRASESDHRSSPGVLSQRDMARWYLRANNLYARFDRMTNASPVVNSVEADSVPCILYAKICRNGCDVPARAVQQQLKYYFWPDEVRELDAGGGVQLTSRGLGHVLELMMVLPNVEMLDLSGNRLEPDHVTELCKKARLHESLRRIKLNNSRSIGRRAGLQLRELLKDNRRVVDIECQNTQIDAPLLAQLQQLGADNKRANAKCFATDIMQDVISQQQQHQSPEPLPQPARAQEPEREREHDSAPKGEVRELPSFERSAMSTPPAGNIARHLKRPRTAGSSRPTPAAARAKVKRHSIPVQLTSLS